MNIGSVLILIALLVLDRFWHKRFPRVLSAHPAAGADPCEPAGGSVLCLPGIRGVASPDQQRSAGDKGFFVIFIAVVIAVYTAILIFAWADWLRKRRRTP